MLEFVVKQRAWKPLFRYIWTLSWFVITLPLLAEPYARVCEGIYLSSVFTDIYYGCLVEYPFF